MKHLRKIALLLFASLILLSPTLASAMVGGDEMPDCQLEPEMCTELIVQQDEQIAALEAQLEEAGITPVTKLSVAEETENAASVNISGDFPYEVPPEWQFVVDYRQNTVETLSAFCTNPPYQRDLAKRWSWVEQGYDIEDVYDDLDDPSVFVTDIGKQYFYLKDVFTSKLAMAQESTDQVPAWVPMEPYAFYEILPLLDAMYPGCSTGDYA